VHVVIKDDCLHVASATSWNTGAVLAITFVCLTIPVSAVPKASPVEAFMGPVVISIKLVRLNENEKYYLSTEQCLVVRVDKFVGVLFVYRPGASKIDRGSYC